MDNSLIRYLDQLTFDYTQLCQRDDKSVYGIASGKQCRKGKPISFNPNDLKLGAKPGLKQVRVKDKDKVKNIVAKAKAIGLNNKEIRQIKEEVKQELNAKRVKGKEALKLFAKKANQLAKEKRANTTKLDRSNLQLSEDPNTKFMIPNSPKGYDIEKDISKPGVTLGAGAMGKVNISNGPPPGIIKQGKIGQYEAEALARLQGTGVAPDFHGIKFTPPYNPLLVGFDYGGHVREQEGYLAMSKIEGKSIANSDLGSKSISERDAIERSLYQARKIIHQNGIAHNDMHSRNVYVKPDGTIGVIDFGLAQVGYKFALIEAMGSIGGGDWQFDKYYGWQNNLFITKSPSRTRFEDNRLKAKQYLESIGANWHYYNIPKGIRTPQSKVDASPLANLTDDQIKKTLDILYEGF